MARRPFGRWHETRVPGPACTAPRGARDGRRLASRFGSCGWRGALARLLLPMLLAATLAACGSSGATPVGGPADSSSGSPVSGQALAVTATTLATPAVPPPPEPTATSPAAPRPATATVEQPKTGPLAPPAAAAKPGPGQATVVFFVPTITCPSCAARIKASAKKDPGVVETQVVLETQEVTVTYDPAKTDPDKIAEAIRAGGDVVIAR